MVDSEENCKFGLGVEGLTNRFHTAVGLFSNWSQTTSKCGTQGRAKCVTAVLTTFWCLFFYSVRGNKFLFPILDLQGWALVAPGDPWHLAFALGQLGGFFSLKAYAGLPGFQNLRALGSLQFFWEPSLVLFQFVLSFPPASFVSYPSCSHHGRSHHNKDHAIAISFL